MVLKEMNDAKPFVMVDKKTNASQGKDTFRSEIRRVHLKL